MNATLRAGDPAAIKTSAPVSSSAIARTNWGARFLAALDLDIFCDLALACDVIRLRRYAHLNTAALALAIVLTTEQIDVVHDAIPERQHFNRNIRFYVGV